MRQRIWYNGYSDSKALEGIQDMSEKESITAHFFVMIHASMWTENLLVGYVATTQYDKWSDVWESDNENIYEDLRHVLLSGYRGVVTRVNFNLVDLPEKTEIDYGAWGKTTRPYCEQDFLDIALDYDFELVVRKDTYRGIYSHSRLFAELKQFEDSIHYQKPKQVVRDPKFQIAKRLLKFVNRTRGGYVYLAYSCDLDIFKIATTAEVNTGLYQTMSSSPLLKSIDLIAASPYCENVELVAELFRLQHQQWQYINPVLPSKTRWFKLPQYAIDYLGRNVPIWTDNMVLRYINDYFPATGVQAA